MHLKHSIYYNCSHFDGQCLAIEPVRCLTKYCAVHEMQNRKLSTTKQCCSISLRMWTRMINLLLPYSSLKRIGLTQWRVHNNFIFLFVLCFSFLQFKPLKRYGLKNSEPLKRYVCVCVHLYTFAFLCAIFYCLMPRFTFSWFLVCHRDWKWCSRCEEKSKRQKESDEVNAIKATQVTKNSCFHSIALHWISECSLLTTLLLFLHFVW